MKFKHKKIFHALLFFFVMSGIFFSIGNVNIMGRDYSAMVPLDYSIPLIPFFVIFYISAWAFYLIPFLSSKDDKELRKIMKYFYALVFINAAIFLVFPTTMPFKGEISENSMFDSAMKWVRQNDVRYNNMPSMHISLTTLSLIFLLGNKKLKMKNKIMYYAWYLLIVASVVLTKQHSFLDIPSGIALAMLVYYTPQILEK